MKLTRDTIVKRISGKYSIDKNGCWVWSGSTSPNGYPVTVFEGVKYVVRRLVFAYLRNASPSEKRKLKTRTLKSTCGNPRCINPDHLYMTDSTKRGRKE